MSIIKEKTTMRAVCNDDDNDKCFFAFTPISEKKKNSIAITNSITVTYSGGVKQHGRVANGLQVKQPPRGNENITFSTTISSCC